MHIQVVILLRQWGRESNFSHDSDCRKGWIGVRGMGGLSLGAACPISDPNKPKLWPLITLTRRAISPAADTPVTGGFASDAPPSPSFLSFSASSRTSQHPSSPHRQKPFRPGRWPLTTIIANNFRQWIKIIYITCQRLRTRLWARIYRRPLSTVKNGDYQRLLWALRWEGLSDCAGWDLGWTCSTVHKLTCTCLCDKNLRKHS